MTKRGEALPQAKLKESDIRGIRLAIAEGASTSEVARWYKISRIHVWRIARRKSWSHVD